MRDPVSNFLTKRPGNPDIQGQEIFAEQHEEFMLRKSGDIEVLFVDAVHPQHNTMSD
jgi:hypothetical protein